MNTIILILAFISAAFNLAYFNRFSIRLLNKENRKSVFKAYKHEDEFKIIMHWVNIGILILGLVYYDINTIVLLFQKLMQGDLFNQILAFGYDAITFAFTLLTDAVSDALPEGVSDFIENILGYFNITPGESVVAAFGLLVSIVLNLSVIINLYKKDALKVRSEDDFLFADDINSDYPQEYILNLMVFEGCGILPETEVLEQFGMHSTDAAARQFNVQLFQTHLKAYFEDEGIFINPIDNPNNQYKKYAVKREKTFNQLYIKPMKAFNQLILTDRQAFIGIVLKIELVLSKLIEGSQTPELIKQFKRSDNATVVDFRGVSDNINTLKTYLSARKNALFAEELKQLQVDHNDILKFAENVVKLLLKPELDYTKEEKQRLFGFVQKCF